MADRGNVTKRDSTQNFISLVGQTTTGLPLSTGSDSFFQTGANYDGSTSDTFIQFTPPLSAIMPPNNTDDGYTLPLTSQYLYISATNPTTFVTPGGGGTSVTIYYKMQGYYIAGATYETWIAVNAPNTSNPSGHPLINIVIASIFSHS